VVAALGVLASAQEGAGIVDRGMESVRQAVRIGNRDVVEQILQLLADPDDKWLAHRTELLMLLSECEGDIGTKAVDIIVDVCESGSVRVRTEGLRALGALGAGEAVVRSLYLALPDTAKAKVVRDLRRCGVAGARGFVASGLRSDSEAMRWSCVRAAGETGDIVLCNVIAEMFAEGLLRGLEPAVVVRAIACSDASSTILVRMRSGILGEGWVASSQVELARTGNEEALAWVCEECPDELALVMWDADDEKGAKIVERFGLSAMTIAEIAELVSESLGRPVSIGEDVDLSSQPFADRERWSYLPLRPTGLEVLQFLRAGLHTAGDDFRWSYEDGAVKIVTRTEYDAWRSKVSEMIKR